MKRIGFGVPEEDYEVIVAEARRRGLKPAQVARSAVLGDVKRSLNRSKSLDDVMQRRFLKWIRENRDSVLEALGPEETSPEHVPEWEDRLHPPSALAETCSRFRTRRHSSPVSRKSMSLVRGGTRPTWGCRSGRRFSPPFPTLSCGRFLRMRGKCR